MDFIFGDADAVFYADNIKLEDRGATAGGTNGYMTAPPPTAATPRVPDRLCAISSSAARSTFYLGRPWHPYTGADPQIVVRDTSLPAQIKSAPWTTMSGFSFNPGRNRSTTTPAQARARAPAGRSSRLPRPPATRPRPTWPAATAGPVELTRPPAGTGIEWAACLLSPTLPWLIWSSSLDGSPSSAASTTWTWWANWRSLRPVVAATVRGSDYYAVFLETGSRPAP